MGVLGLVVAIASIVACSEGGTSLLAQVDRQSTHFAERGRPDGLNILVIFGAALNGSVLTLFNGARQPTWAVTRRFHTLCQPKLAL